jgi:antitoxin PrlF
MGIVFSKVSVKCQTVIPCEIRDMLGLKPGDRLRFSLTDKGIMIDKAGLPVDDDPFAVFSEWASEADEKAYADL